MWICGICSAEDLKGSVKKKRIIEEFENYDFI